ncbi:hypothetical protein DM02DRAFT_651618 [Periconia macrospinosa]|uniref:Uncharacterized protein n=1 Tax=Periconia macrospinosa TaxID=97972 RepID=A0A2V1E2H9_9PLEO|nr:hypothetical protein DM02DRAFT_651618 [Periconia macrospinosa]
MPQQPHKRGLLSLNLESDVEHLAQRVEDGINNSYARSSASRSSSRSHQDGTKGRQRTSVEILTKPFEQAVQRTVDGVLKEEKINPSPGKKVVSAGSGELTTTTITAKSTNSDEPVVRKTIVKQDISGGNTHRRDRTSSPVDLESLEAQYDTSDL